MKQPRWIGACLLLLLAVSFGLRVANSLPGLDQRRFWDERYSVVNVTTVLASGSLRPENAFYLGLNHLPQVAALRTIEIVQGVVGAEWVPVERQAGIRVSREARLVFRVIQSIYGTLSIWLLFLIGRRLFSPEVGLLAALLLSVMPLHIRMSSFFKPDILVLMLTLLAFYWTIAALERPSLKRYLLVGLAVGLATSGKYTGIPAAIPLTVGVFAGGPGLWRRLGWLVGAGVTSLVTFVLLNPHLDLVFEYLPKISHAIEMRAARGDTTRADVPAYLLRMVVAKDTHGLVLGAVALLGLALMVRTAVRYRVDRERLFAPGLVLVFTFGFLAYYFLGSPDLKSNSLLSLFPFTSLAAAWLLWCGWLRSVAWDHRLARPVVAVVLWGLIAGMPLLGATRYVAREWLPAEGERPRRSQLAVDWQREEDGTVTFESPSPRATADGSVSLVIWLPEAMGETRLELGEQAVALRGTRQRRDGRRRFLSAEFRPPEVPVRMRLVPEQADPQIPIEIFIRYARPGTGEEEDSGD
jgi:hypothetical protein